MVPEWETALLILKTTQMLANLVVMAIYPKIYLLLFFPHLVMLYYKRVSVFQACNTNNSFSLFFSALYYSHFIKHSQSLRKVNHLTTDLAHKSTQQSY